MRNPPLQQILLSLFWLYKYFLRSDSCLVLYLYCLCQFRTKQVSLRLSLGIFFFSACIFGVLIVLTQVPICGVVSCLNVSNVTLSRLRLGLLMEWVLSGDRLREHSWEILAPGVQFTDDHCKIETHWKCLTPSIRQKIHFLDLLFGCPPLNTTNFSAETKYKRHVT